MRRIRHNDHGMPALGFCEAPQRPGLSPRCRRVWVEAANGEAIPLMLAEIRQPKSVGSDRIRERHLGSESLQRMRRPPREWFSVKRWAHQIGYWLVIALFNVFPLPQARDFQASFAHTGRALDHETEDAFERLRVAGYL